MLIKPKLEYTALLGDKIEISLQNFAIEQRISGIAFYLNIIFISRVEYQPFVKGVRVRLVCDSGPVHTCKPKLEYTALLGDKIEILQYTLQSLQDFAIEQSISEFVFF